MKVVTKRIPFFLCAFVITIFIISLIQSPNFVTIEDYQEGHDIDRTFAASAVSAPEVLWNETFGGSHSDQFNDIIECNNGDYVAVGWDYVDATNGWDGWIVRMNETHDIVWERTYGGLVEDRFKYVVELSNGDFVIAGSTGRVDADGDFWLFRTNSTGHYDYDGSKWNSTFGGGARERVFGLVQTDDDGFAMCGETISYGPGGLDAWLVKVNSTGDYKWNETYGTATGSEIFYGMTICEGGFAFAGYGFGDYTTGVDGYVVRTDSVGTELWNSSFGFSSNDYLDSIVANDDGSFSVAGEARISGTYRYWLGHTNSTGTLESYKLWYGGATAEHYDMIKLNDGGYVMVGKTGTSPTSDLWVLRADAEGEYVWDIHIGETNDDVGYGVTEAVDGTIVIAGITDNYGADSQDGWLLELSSPLSWGKTPADQLVEAGVSFRYDINASSSNGIDDWWLNDTSSFTIDSSGVITNSSNLDIGDYPLRIFVNDTTGDNLDANITVSIEDTIFPIWTLGATDQVVEYGDSLNYQVSAADASGIAQYSVNDTTNFAIDSTGLLTNSTALAVEVYGLNVTASDSSGHTIFTEFTLTVSDTTDPTWVFQPENQQLTSDEAFSYQLSAFDLSGVGVWNVNDTTNFAISSSGLITNATLLQVGNYGLNISVEDIHGNKVSIIISVQVLSSTTTTTTTTTTDTETTLTDTTPTTTTPPDDNTLLYLVIGGLVSIIIVLAIVVSIRRKAG